MGSFGDQIKSARNLGPRRLTQQTLCDLINTNLSGDALMQSKLSDWERGKSVPDPDRVDDRLILEQLAKALDLDEEMLIDLCYADRSKSTLTVMSEQEYLEEVGRYIKVHEHQVSLWFVGPRTLPVKNSTPFKQAWAENIKAGITYNVVWFLDGIRPDDLHSLIYELEVVGEIAGTGTIIHHAVRISKEISCGDSDRIYERIQQANRSREKNGALHAKNRFYDVKCLDTDLAAVRGLFLTFWQAFSSVVLLRPTDELRKPLASLTVRNTSNNFTRNPSRQDIFVFLDPDQALKLKRLVEALMVSEDSSVEQS